MDFSKIKNFVNKSCKISANDFAADSYDESISSCGLTGGLERAIRETNNIETYLKKYKNFMDSDRAGTWKQELS